MAALVALLKLALNARGDECSIKWLVGQDAGVRLATARHSSQVSQLPQSDTASSVDGCECIVQSACMGLWLARLATPACATVAAAMSTAMMLPAQPRKGSNTSIRAMNRIRVERSMYQ